MTKVVVTGAAGRMGQKIIRCSQRFDDVEIVGAVESSESPNLGEDIGELSGIGELGVKISDDLDAALSGDADVLIDFTFHTIVTENVKVAARHGRAVVIGTTGLTDEEALLVNNSADKIPIVWAPNMSLGVNLLFAVVKKAAEVLNSQYTVELNETHHVHKKDSPSGTALMLGEKVADGLKKDFREIMVHDEDGSIKDHPEGKIVIHSHREGEVIGEHTVAFESETERIEFRHHAESRDAFAMGAIRAAGWVTTQRPRLYDMQDVLGL